MGFFYVCMQSCCGRYISSAAAAPTAEALLRSRFSAYKLGEVDYLVDTTHVANPEHTGGTWGKRGGGRWKVGDGEGQGRDGTGTYKKSGERLWHVNNQCTLHIVLTQSIQVRVG